MAEGTLVRPAGVVHYEDTVDRKAGDVVTLPDGRAGIIQGLNSDVMTAGETIAALTEGTFDIAALTGDLFSAGDALYWDDTGKVATAAAGGNTYLGIAGEDKAAGPVLVRVRLNVGALP